LGDKTTERGSAACQLLGWGKDYLTGIAGLIQPVHASTGSYCSRMDHQRLALPARVQTHLPKPASDHGDLICSPITMALVANRLLRRLPINHYGCIQS